MVPLEHALVIELSSKKSVLTKTDGSFLFSVPANDIAIRVTYQGYKSLGKNFRRPVLQKLTSDTLTLDLVLTENTEMLEQVDIGITVKDIELTYGRASMLVIDYGFYRDGLLLLIKEKSKYKLRYVNAYDSLVAECVLPFKKPRPKSLFKDCLNNYHIRTPDSIYQVFDINNKLILDKGFAAVTFDRTVVPCVASSSEALYFGTYGALNQSILYYLVEMATGNREIIRDIKAKKKDKGTAEFGNNAKGQMMSLPDRTAEVDTDVLKEFRNAQTNAWFYDRVLTKKSYHPLFSTEDSVIVFDHFADSAFVSGLLAEHGSQYLTTHQYEKGWKNEIVTDLPRQKFYATCNRGGLVYLLELDKNFKIKKEYKLSKHIFPEKLRVRNGYAYYLYNTRDEVSVKNLYRQRLK